MASQQLIGPEKLAVVQLTKDESTVRIGFWLGEEFTGGDPGITQSLGAMWANEPSLGEQSGIDAELFGYIGTAMEGLKP